MTPRFTNMGKQVLDRAHYADARDIPAAEAIASALNDLPALVEVYHAAHDYLHSVHRTSTWVASQRLSAALKAAEPIASTHPSVEAVS